VRRAFCKVSIYLTEHTLLLGASLLGLGWSWFRRLPLFHLPSDIVIGRPGFRFFFPITTMLLISALISPLAWALRR
jgi:DUF2905 family protein